MDDFVLLHDDKQYLHELKRRITEFLAARLRLTVHPKKAQIEPVRSGVNFLGFRIFPHHRLLRASTVKRFVARAKAANRGGELIGRFSALVAFMGECHKFSRASHFTREAPWRPAHLYCLNQTVIKLAANPIV